MKTAPSFKNLKTMFMYITQFPLFIRYNVQNVRSDIGLKYKGSFILLKDQVSN